MQTRSYLQRRANSESSDRLVANIKPRPWGNQQHEKPQTTQPPPRVHDFSHVDLFAHDPGPRTIPPGVQAKLTVGAPNDVYEQEADRVAEQVMSMPAAQPNECNLNAVVNPARPESYVPKTVVTIHHFIDVYGETLKPFQAKLVYLAAIG